MIARNQLSKCDINCLWDPYEWLPLLGKVESKLAYTNFSALTDIWKSVLHAQ